MLQARAIISLDDDGIKTCSSKSCHLGCRYVPPEKGPKNKTSKSCLEVTRMARTIERGGGGGGVAPVNRTRGRGGSSAPAMQMRENVNRTIDGIEDSPPAENPFRGGMKSTNPQALPMALEFPDYTTYLDAETGHFLPPAKKEGYASFTDSTRQLHDLMSVDEYEELEDEFLASFGVPPSANVDGLLSSSG